MEQLIDLQNAVKYKPAEIQFSQYEVLKSDAVELAERIKAVEVTEENVKEVKKDLALVRKLVNELNNRRKLVKAEILKQYNTFESQIKEIDTIITEAEETVRTQTKALEEAERNRKCDAVREIWDKRIDQYSIARFGDYFYRWLQPQHLNKTTSMKSIEKDMVEWLETRQKDIDTLSVMGAEYVAEYLETLDINVAIRIVNRKRDIADMLAEGQTEETATFIIIGKKNIKLTEVLLTENDIEFRKEK